jgi:hypothetical protein
MKQNQNLNSTIGNAFVALKAISHDKTRNLFSETLKFQFDVFEHAEENLIKFLNLSILSVEFVNLRFSHIILQGNSSGGIKNKFELSLESHTSEHYSNIRMWCNSVRQRYPQGFVGLMVVVRVFE